MGKKLMRTTVLGVLIVGLAACGGSKNAGDTTTTAVGGSGDGGSSTTAVAAGGSITTGAGGSVGTPGAVGYFRAFKYTVKRTSVASGTDPAKQKLTVVLDYENVSQATVEPAKSFTDFKLDGDQSQGADDAKASPEGQVAPGTKGTVTAIFDIGSSFDVSKVSIVIGDPNRYDAPILPLGSGGKKQTQEKKDSTVSFSITGAKGGVSVTGTKVSIGGASPEQNEHAEKGKAFVFVSVSVKGGAAEESLNFNDVKLKQPDGTIKDLEAFVTGPKVDTTLTVSPGQTKDAVIVFVLEQKSKASGAYELHVVPESGETPVKGAFTVT